MQSILWNDDPKRDLSLLAEHPEHAPSPLHRFYSSAPKIQKASKANSANHQLQKPQGFVFGFSSQPPAKQERALRELSRTLPK